MGHIFLLLCMLYNFSLDAKCWEFCVLGAEYICIPINITVFWDAGKLLRNGIILFSLAF